MPKLYNKHKDKVPPDAIYIGRGSDFGNPFKIGEHGDRAEVIRKFEDKLRTHPHRTELVQTIRERLGGKDLVCFCAPLPCHGDVLMRIANSTGDPWAETSTPVKETTRAKPLNSKTLAAIPTALETLDGEIAYLTSAIATSTPNLKLRFEQKKDELIRVREWLESKHAHAQTETPE